MTGLKFDAASSETMALMRKISEQAMGDTTGETDNLVYWADDGQLLGYGESDTTGNWIKIRVLPEDMAKFRGLKGTVFYWTAVQLADDGVPIPVLINTGSSNGRTTGFEPVNGGSTPSPVTKPHGKEAAELYKNGFFLVPDVLEAIGTDKEFLDWLKTQECPVKTKEHQGDIVPAHVRRIANGAGTSIKPEYSAIPLCDKHHKQQHQLGESAIGGKAWVDSQRIRFLQNWASHKLAREAFNEVSMGYVLPSRLKEWASAQGIEKWLPVSYR